MNKQYVDSLCCIILWPTEMYKSIGTHFTRFIKTPQAYYNTLRGRESVIRAPWLSLSNCRIIKHSQQLHIDNRALLTIENHRKVNIKSYFNQRITKINYESIKGVQIKVTQRQWQGKRCHVQGEHFTLTFSGISKIPTIQIKIISHEFEWLHIRKHSIFWSHLR